MKVVGLLVGLLAPSLAFYEAILVILPAILFVIKLPVASAVFFIGVNEAVLSA